MAERRPWKHTHVKPSCGQPRRLLKWECSCPTQSDDTQGLVVFVSVCFFRPKTGLLALRLRARGTRLWGRCTFAFPLSYFGGLCVGRETVCTLVRIPFVPATLYQVAAHICPEEKKNG